MFDTVCHNNLLSKIIRSQLPPATARWLSYYLRGRQAKTCFRGVKSTSRKVNTGVPQGSKLSPSLFSFYIADMLIPTEPVSWEIDHQLCCTCLEYMHMQHKLQKHPIYTERGSEDCHWLSQDVQGRPPTRRS